MRDPGPAKRRVFITGGSGFIGTNLVEHYRRRECAVVNFDLNAPRNAAHHDYWVVGDVRDASSLRPVLTEFAPDLVIHAAARTDLDGRSIADYDANTQGVKALIEAAIDLKGLRSVVFFSSMLVCRLGYVPQSETDYCPTTLYGESKVLGEQMVRVVSTKDLPWVLVRPTSIWGPWFAAPYRNFFNAIHKGWFVLPRKVRSVRSYGYVGNLVAQVATIAEQESRCVGHTYYLADYEPLHLEEWANRISNAWGRGRVREVPLSALRAGALLGDLAKSFGVKQTPLSSFRLNNLLTSAVFDMAETKAVCPSLPVGVDEGIKLTVDWLRNHH